MGDRGNIAVRQEDGTHIFLYTHWGGSDIAGDLRTALSKRWRWNDHAYLTRIIFDVMTAQDHDNETGYGISNLPPDNEHPILEVDCEHQVVNLIEAPWPTKSKLGGSVVASMSFEEYVTYKGEIDVWANPEV